MFEDILTIPADKLTDADLEAIERAAIALVQVLRRVRGKPPLPTGNQVRKKANECKCRAG